MIMILAISVTGIAAVIAWGLPAVDEMKASVEARAVTNQFKELEHDVKQLVSGTADRTAKRWQPTLSRGSIDFVDHTQRWVFGYASCANGNAALCTEAIEYSWSLKDISDTDDHLFIIHNSGGEAVNTDVTAVRLNNGAETVLRVSSNADCETVWAGASLADGADQTLYLCATDGHEVHFDTALDASPSPDADPHGAEDEVIRITITDDDNDETAAEFWIFDSGEARFTLDTVGSKKNVYLSNGAVVVGNAGREVIDNTPGVPAPRNTPNGWQFFVRGSSFQGSASFGGEDRFDVLLSLYGTSTLSEEANVGEVYVYVGGDHKDAWESYFQSDSAYSFTADSDADASMKAFSKRMDANAPVDFTLVHSVILVES